MFEQAVLNNGPAGKRAWTTFLGMTGQVALVSVAILVPMVSPQVLPLAKLSISLVPPVPPGAPPAKLGPDTVRKTSGHVIRVPFRPTGIVAPINVPTKIQLLDDRPEGNFVVGGNTGPAGAPDGVVTGIIQGLEALARPIPLPHIDTTSAKAAPEPAPTIQRFHAGGNVHLGTLLHRAETVYPLLAKAARVQGVVELECVVGVDGHITEVKVKSGNPMLIKAAVDAAWQYVYEPSRLNGVPIELITNLNFNFKLN